MSARVSSGSAHKGDPTTVKLGRIGISPPAPDTKSTALVGFLGVIVGGVLSGGIQTTIAWHDRIRAGRMAARLIYMDLWRAGLALGSARNERRWNPRIDWDTLTATWAEHREALAYVLPTASILTVASTFTAIEQARTIRAADLTTQAERPTGTVVFTADDSMLQTYDANLGAAMLVVHDAALTWYERRHGLVPALGAEMPR